MTEASGSIGATHRTIQYSGQTTETRGATLLKQSADGTAITIQQANQDAQVPLKTNLTPSDSMQLTGGYNSKGQIIAALKVSIDARI